MNEYNSELKTLWSAVFHPFLIVFYILELMALFLFNEFDLSFMPESLMRVEFAKRIGESTNFPDKAYIFSLIMIMSLFSVPISVKKIIPSESVRLKARFDEDPKRALGALLFSCALLGAIFFVVFVDFGDPSFCAGCTTSSELRLMLAYGVLLPFLFAYSLSAVIIATKYLLNIRGAK